MIISAFMLPVSNASAEQFEGKQKTGEQQINNTKGGQI
jgi:hypothetical protein